MRVVFLASTLKLGGAERVTADISKGLEKAGFDVTWALLREPGPVGDALEASGTALRSGLASSRLDPLSTFRLRKLFRDVKAEAIYCLDHQNAVVAGALAARAAGVKRLFLAVHTTGLWGGRPSLPRGVRAVLPAFTRVVAVAENQARYLAAEEGVDPARIVVIKNGIDLARFAATPERQKRGLELRAEFSGGSPAPVVGIVAALRPEKGHSVLLHAMLPVVAAHPGARLVIVGEGPARTELESLAKGLGLKAAVRFLGARDDVPDLLQAFDMVALSSHPFVETLPLAVMEAMAAGKPVVATRVGSVEELVEDGTTGFLVPPDDPEALARALLRLAGERSLREKFSRAATERAPEFDIAATVARTAALLERGL